MTFSIQNNPYLSMHQPTNAPSSDCAISRKTPGFRQSLPSRLHGLPGLDLVNSILASYRSNKLKSEAVAQSHLSCPPINPLLTSPGWFQQALVNSLLLPRPFVDDPCPPATQVRPPDVGELISPKIPRPIPTSPAMSKSRTSSCDSVLRVEKDTHDPLLYCRSTFYPLLKDQVDRVHSSWRTSDAPKHHNSSSVAETGTLVPSLIDGELIMGFNVWGEKRLCLPHLFRFVLNDVDLKAIDEACTKLQITCTTCTPAQLKLLHARGILPKAVSTCGLIRKSDAERLTKFIRNRSEPLVGTTAPVCSGLLPNRPCTGGELEVIDPSQVKHPDLNSRRLSYVPCKDATDGTNESQRSTLSLIGGTDGPRKRDSSTESSVRSNEPIPVIHECFGRQSGLIHPELYTEPAAKCIECLTCHRLFAPDQFVGHTHTVTEVDNLNHWGFDSNNWRCYLRLYTGRQGCTVASGPHLSNAEEASEDEVDNDLKSGTITTETHRRLEEFKIKFAQPIRLPPSLSAALRTVGLCASVAPIPPTSIFPTNPVLDNTDVRAPYALNPSARIMPSNASRFPAFPKEANTVSPTVAPSPSSPAASTPTPLHPTIPSSLASVILPQLTLRRLWAPNDGRIKVPAPPKPKAARDQSFLPKKLHTGPPVLLHSHRVVSQSAADQYDRDFIPNVCLMPPLGMKYHKSSCTSHGRRSRVSRDCSCRRSDYYVHSRNLSSGSRSRSRSCSSGSSSSRTRSVSMSSTTSSCYSEGRSCKRYCDGQSPCSPGSRSSSSESVVHVEECNPLPFNKDFHAVHTINKPTASPSTLSHNSSEQHSRGQSLRRRYRSAELSSVTSPPPSHQVKCRRARSTSPVLCNSLDRYSPPPEHMARQCSVTPSSKVVWSPTRPKRSRVDRHRNHHNHHQHHTQPHDRALAAARAVQGAASRITPGLWSRHFINLKGNTTNTLELPKARHSVPAALTGPGSDMLTGNVRDLPGHNHNPTPVVVTSPDTNSLPSAVLALESIWTDLVRHINEYTLAVETRNGIPDARQRLFEQFISMQTCYATHIAALMNENQKLRERLASIESQAKNTLPVSTESVPKDTRSSSGISFERGLCDSQPLGVTNFQPLYPHRNRKEPQPTRTLHNPQLDQSGLLSIANDGDIIHQSISKAPERRSEKMCISDNRSSNTSLYSLHHARNDGDLVAQKFRPLGTPEQLSDSSNQDQNNQNHSKSIPTKQDGRTLLDIDVHSRIAVDSSSAAPYKVSSGLCDRRLSEKYRFDRVHWKRRAWDPNMKQESNGSLDLSVQSTEPVAQKRRTISIADTNS